MDDAEWREAALDAAIEEYRQATLPPDFATRPRMSFEEILARIEQMSEREKSEIPGVGTGPWRRRCGARDRW